MTFGFEVIIVDEMEMPIILVQVSKTLGIIISK